MPISHFNCKRFRRNRGKDKVLITQQNANGGDANSVANGEIFSLGQVGSGSSAFNNVSVSSSSSACSTLYLHFIIDIAEKFGRFVLLRHECWCRKWKFHVDEFFGDVADDSGGAVDPDDWEFGEWVVGFAWVEVRAWAVVLRVGGCNLH